MAWFRKKMWLDVEEGWAGWIDTPNNGADASTDGWGTTATFLNGGGYAANSWSTHKRYTFEWSGASTRQAAQFMQSLRNGAYGKGLIRFIEPTIYDTNILPARIAQPSLMVDDFGLPLVFGVDPGDVAAPGWKNNDNSIPVRAARWDLGSVAVGYRGKAEAVYIPIPEGYTLALGAIYNSSGSGGIFVETQGFSLRLPERSPTTSNMVAPLELMLSGERYVRLWIGKDAPGSAFVTATALSARLIPTNRVFERPTTGFGYGEQPYGAGPYGGSALSATWRRMADGPWVGGMGNSGVRFNGTPTMVHNTGVNGGQVGYSASFIETGSWG